MVHCTVQLQEGIVTAGTSSGNIDSSEILVAEVYQYAYVVVDADSKRDFLPQFSF